VRRVLPCDGVHGLWSPLPDSCLEIIDTDRPHQTDTPHVVPAGHTQIESAIAQVQLGGTRDATDMRTHLVLLEDNYKFGLVTHVDFQLLFKHADYVFDAGKFVSPGPLEARVKINLVEGHEATPAVTIVPSVFVPMTSAQALRVGALVFLGWELPLGFELEVNTGLLAQTAFKPTALVVFAAAVTHRVVGPLSTFVDIYATGADVQLGTGFLAPIGRDAQIDLGTYVGLNGAVFLATPFIGFSIRR
jgi:hypothetical protein